MRGVSWRLVLTIALGTVLNPLNGSMIAVALVPLHNDFHVDLGTSTLLVSGYYLTASVGQPVMGRIADLFGARRIFLIGAVMTAAIATLAPLSPSFQWLVAARAFQALATSAAYPAGLGMIRTAARGDRVPARALAIMTMAASVSAALGPTVGGLVISLAGWQGLFIVNLPFAVAALALGLRWLPKSPPRITASGLGLARIDLPGVFLFGATLTTLLAGLLSFGSSESWLLLAAVPLFGALLVLWETRADTPFFDLRLLAANPALVGVFVQFAAVTFVFYSYFFALPVWLEDVRGIDAKTAGLLILPVTGLGVLLTPVSANLIGRGGPRSSLIIGSAFMCLGCGLLLTLGQTTPLIALLGVAIVVGVPNGFNNMGLQAELYKSAPPDRISWAAGQFQTFRFFGAALSSTLIAAIFPHRATTNGLHSIAIVLAIIAAALIVASVATRRGPHLRDEAPAQASG
jgi:MFS family permease